MTFLLGACLVGTAGWVIYVLKTVRTNEMAIQKTLAQLHRAPEVRSDALTELTAAVGRLDQRVVAWSDLSAGAASRIGDLLETVERHRAEGGAIQRTDDMDLDDLVASSLTAPLSEKAFLTSYRVSARLQRLVVEGSREKLASVEPLAGSPTEEKALLRLLGLDPHLAAVFCVPVLEPGDVKSSALGTAIPEHMGSGVAIEDVLATKTTLGALLAEWPVEADEPGLALVNPRTPRATETRNILSLCSVRRNPITAWLLDESGPASAMAVRLRVDTDERGRLLQWIDFNGTRLDSPSHQQELERDDLFDGPADDFALIARVPNRLDPTGSTKAVVIAGLRAFGTWGAAKFLATSSNQLLRKSEGRDFAAVLRVTARAVQVGSDMRYANSPDVEITEYCLVAA